MSKEFLAEDIRKIADILNGLTEADIKKDDQNNSDVNNNPAAVTPNSTSNIAADVNADAGIDDMMTHEKKPQKLQGSIAVKSLAELLGIKNTTLFAAAFNALRAGKLPNNTAQIRELAIAFDKLLAADASTTTKVLNQLRRIHKAS